MADIKCFECPSCGHWQHVEDCSRRSDYHVGQVPDDVGSPLDCGQCGSIFDRHSLDFRLFPTRQDIVDEFLEHVLPAVKLQYEQDGIPDLPARRKAWNNWTDSLCKDRRITPRQYEEWDQPGECGAVTCPRCNGKGVLR